MEMNAVWRTFDTLWCFLKLAVLDYVWLFFSITDLAYNIALCYYSLKQYASALKYIAEIIERGIREHPGMCNRKSFKMCDVIQLISVNDSYVSILMIL